MTQRNSGSLGRLVLNLAALLGCFLLWLVYDTNQKTTQMTAVMSDVLIEMRKTSKGIDKSNAFWVDIKRQQDSVNRVRRAREDSIRNSQRPGQR